MADARDVVLVLDQGSSSSRALAFDRAGRVVAAARRELETLYPRPEHIEHDAAELLAGQLGALDDCLAALPRSRPVAAVGLACQRSSVVCWSAKTGKPLAPVLSWRDGRAGAETAGLRLDPAEVHALTGLYLTPYYSAPKIRWMLARSARLRAARRSGDLRIGPVSSYLIWHLTRGAAFAVDPTMAQRTLLYDIRRREWSQTLLDAFDVPRAALPELRPSAGDWGAAARGGRSLPLRLVLGDQQAAFAAQEKPAPRLNYGTGAFLMVPSGAHAPDVPGILTSVALERAAGDAEYFLEGTMNAAASTYTWLERNFGFLGSPKEVDRMCRLSKHRVWALPALGGLGAPRWDYACPTALVGLSAGTRPADLVRGFTEGIAHMMADIADAIGEAGHALGAVSAAGGLSRIDHLLQTQADLLGVPVARTRDQEMTALGTARLLWRGLGRPMRKKSASARVFKPKLAAGQRRRRRDGWRTFVAAMQSLKDI